MCSNTGDKMAGKQESSEHSNDERTVKCPVEECDETPLARGIHLHVMRSAGGGHGEQNEVPEGIDFDNLETVGSREVKMNYPEQRETETVARLCPYCERPFRGKHGVMIHLGQVAGRKDHPKDAAKRHEPDDFAIVTVDDEENIVDVVEEETTMPSTDDRLQGAKVKSYIASLRARGFDEQADEAEEMLLD